MSNDKDGYLDFTLPWALFPQLADGGDQRVKEQVSAGESAGRMEATHKYKTSTRTSSSTTHLNTDSKLYTSNDNVIELVRVIGYEELSIRQMMEFKGLKHRNNFMEYHLEPALKEMFVRRKYPEIPNHPRQRYLLTVKGLALYEELKKKESQQ